MIRKRYILRRFRRHSLRASVRRRRLSRDRPSSTASKTYGQTNTVNEIENTKTGSHTGVGRVYSMRLDRIRKQT